MGGLTLEEDASDASHDARDEQEEVAGYCD